MPLRLFKCSAFLPKFWLLQWQQEAILQFLMSSAPSPDPCPGLASALTSAFYLRGPHWCLWYNWKNRFPLASAQHGIPKRKSPDVILVNTTVRHWHCHSAHSCTSKLLLIDLIFLSSFKMKGNFLPKVWCVRDGLQEIEKAGEKETELVWSGPDTDDDDDDECTHVWALSAHFPSHCALTLLNQEH